MKSPMTFLVLAMLMALAITLSATPPPQEEEQLMFSEDDDNESDQEPTSLRGTSRLLAQTPRAAMTCNKYPRICRTKNSPGPDCCKKKCVNVKTDRLNCGMCGNKCKYSEICCKGVCVNPRFNKNHCGGCNIKCKKGNTCVYGMCSYA